MGRRLRQNKRYEIKLSFWDKKWKKIHCIHDETKCRVSGKKKIEYEIVLLFECQYQFHTDSVRKW